MVPAFWAAVAWDAVEQFLLSGKSTLPLPLPCQFSETLLRERELSRIGAALVKLGVAKQRGSYPSSKARCCHCSSIYPTLPTCLTTGHCFFPPTTYLQQQQWHCLVEKLKPITGHAHWPSALCNRAPELKPHLPAFFSAGSMTKICKAMMRDN